MVGTSSSEILARQLAMCQRFGVVPAPPDSAQKIGLAKNARDRANWPLNGLRHPVVGDTSGWYIWAGEELETRPDFFDPVHVSHLATACPDILPYLALPPGWRFLIAPGYEDIWQDESLLRI